MRSAYYACFGLVFLALLACGPAYGTPDRTPPPSGQTFGPIHYPDVRHVKVGDKDCAYTVNWSGGPISGQEVATQIVCP